jgi:hypothetical protein
MTCCPFNAASYLHGSWRGLNDVLARLNLILIIRCELVMPVNSFLEASLRRKKTDGLSKRKRMVMAQEILLVDIDMYK